MTTLLLSDIFPPKTGGTGRLFWGVYSRLPRADFGAAVGEHPDAAAFDAGHDVRVFRLPLEIRDRALANWTSFKHYLRTTRAVRRLVKAERVRMIHAARPLSEGLVARAVKALTGVPYCCWVHGEDISVASGSRELRLLTTRVLRGATAVIASSGFARELLLANWPVPPDRVRLLRPGVDCTYFRPAEPDAAVRERLGWTGRTVVLTAGRLQRRKGHDTMIEATARLRERFPDLLYAIVGSGDERPRLEELVARLGVSGRVAFMGERSDAELLECYQQCDLFALANRAVGKDVEGFGIVLLEAQACGRPVLAGASGGTAETLRAGASGVVVPCDRPDEPTAALAELLSDRAKLDAMGRAGREWVAGAFDWPVVAAEAQKLFAELAPLS